MFTTLQEEYNELISCIYSSPYTVKPQFQTLGGHLVLKIRGCESLLIYLTPISNKHIQLL